MKKYINYIDHFIDTLWNLLDLNSNNDIGSIAILRIFTGFFMLLFFIPQFSWIGEVPSVFFDPPKFSIANLFNSFPPYEVFFLIDLILVCLVVFITLGFKTRLSCIVLFILSIFAYSFRYSFGKIDHGILIWAMIFLMSFSGWGNRYSIVRAKNTDSEGHYRCLSILAVLICFGFFSAGYSKFFRWIDFDLNTSGILSWYYRGYFNLDRDLLLAPYITKLPTYVFEVMDYTAALFEISGFLFLLLGALYWRIWLLFATLFHMANTLILNIAFKIHVPVFLAFVGISCITGYAGRKWNLTFDNIKFPLFNSAIILGLLHIYYRVTGQGTESVFFNLISIVGLDAIFSGLNTSLILWVTTTIMVIIEVLRQHKNKRKYEETKSKILSDYKLF